MPLPEQLSNTETHLNYTALHQAVAINDLEELQRLLDKGEVDIDAHILDVFQELDSRMGKPYESSTLKVSAQNLDKIKKQFLESLEYTSLEYDFWKEGLELLKYQKYSEEFFLDEQTESVSAVRLAIKHENIPAVKILLEAGAVVDIIDGDIAINSNNIELIKLVVSKIELEEYLNQAENWINEEKGKIIWGGDNELELVKQKVAKWLSIIVQQVCDDEGELEEDEAIDIFTILFSRLSPPATAKLIDESGIFTEVVQEFLFNMTDLLLQYDIKVKSNLLYLSVTDHSVTYYLSHLRSLMHEHGKNIETIDPGAYEKIKNAAFYVGIHNYDYRLTPKELKERIINKLYDSEGKVLEPPCIQMAHKLVEQKAGINLTAGDPVSTNVLFHAISGGWDQLVTKLFQHDVKKVVVDNDDEIKDFLYIPLKNKNLPMLKILLENGIPITAKDWQLATKWGNQEAINLLESKEQPELLAEAIKNIYDHPEAKLTKQDQETLKKLPYLANKQILVEAVKTVCRVETIEAIKMIETVKHITELTEETSQLAKNDHEIAPENVGLLASTTEQINLSEIKDLELSGAEDSNQL